MTCTGIDNTAVLAAPPEPATLAVIKPSALTAKWIMKFPILQKEQKSHKAVLTLSNPAKNLFWVPENKTRIPKSSKRVSHLPKPLKNGRKCNLFANTHPKNASAPGKFEASQREGLGTSPGAPKTRNQS